MSTAENPRNSRGGTEQPPTLDTRQENTTRRSRARRAEEAKPQLPQGFRSTRRTSRAGKQARRAVKFHEFRTAISDRIHDTKNRALGILTLIGLVIAGAVTAVLVLALLVTAINGIARWNARRQAARDQTPAARQERARQNLLVIGVSDGRARGFLALRLDDDERAVFGFAIPDAALMEVPGQGFERVGASYEAGPDTSLATVSNYFTVSFPQYVVVPYEVYQEAVTQQRVDKVIGAAIDTNLAAEDRRRLAAGIARVKNEDVAVAPLPVKPVKVGDETYYEPQRDEVADLLESWWGVRFTAAESPTRLVVYNGSGEPGVAGTAAEELIKAGFRVVSTANADKFGYKLTRVVIQNGSPAEGRRVADVLGTGKIIQQPSDQEIADIIVIIGKDYKPPK